MSNQPTNPQHREQTDLLEQHAGEQTTDAGEFALRVAAFAAAAPPLNTLAAEIASLLQATCAAQSVALFWRRPHERRGPRQRPLLHRLAETTNIPGASARPDQRLKASAYRALIRGEMITREHSGAPDAPTTIAMPLGGASPWAIVVMRWITTTPDAHREHLALLVRLQDTLALALRPAHIREDVRHAEHQSSPRRAIFAITSEAILTIGQDYTIQETNPAFGKIMGYEHHSALGMRCYEVLCCRDERRMLLCDTPRCPLREAFSMESAAPIRDLIWQTHSGKLCEVSANFTAQADADATVGPRAVVVARDVTLLNAANRLRANFISMVSHELRTPLNAINGFLEIVLDGHVGALNERQQEFLSYARTSTQQLTTLVEDILFISRADAGQFTLRHSTFEIPQLIGQVTQALQSAAEKAQVQIVATVAPHVPAVQGDELRVQQVLSNLLNNAIKFSPPESTIHIEARAQNNELILSVSDEGRGVVPEDQARIFERFYQSDSSMRTRTGGYGLGLAIAKLIVEQHGGHIWVESQPEQGAMFAFTIPFKEQVE